MQLCSLNFPRAGFHSEHAKSGGIFARTDNENTATRDHKNGCSAQMFTECILTLCERVTAFHSEKTCFTTVAKLMDLIGARSESKAHFNGFIT